MISFSLDTERSDKSIKNQEQSTRCVGTCKENRHYHELSHARLGHWKSGSADCDSFGAHRRTDRALQNTQERPWIEARPADACLEEAWSSGLSEEDRFRSLPRRHRQTGHSQVGPFDRALRRGHSECNYHIVFHRATPVRKPKSLDYTGVLGRLPRSLHESSYACA